MSYLQKFGLCFDSDIIGVIEDLF